MNYRELLDYHEKGISPSLSTHLIPSILQSDFAKKHIAKRYQRVLLFLKITGYAMLFFATMFLLESAMRPFPIEYGVGLVFVFAAMKLIHRHMAQKIIIYTALTEEGFFHYLDAIEALRFPSQ